MSADSSTSEATSHLVLPSNNPPSMARYITTHSSKIPSSTVHSSNLGSWDVVRPHNYDTDVHISFPSTSPTLQMLRPNGTVCRIVDIAPNSTHTLQTPSPDYIIVVDGSAELVMEDGQSRICGAGDVIVQRGVKYTWRNTDQKKWVLMAAVITQCEKATMGSEILYEDIGISSQSGAGLQIHIL